MRGAFWRDPAFFHPNAGLLQRVPFSYTFRIGLGVVQGYASAGAVLALGQPLECGMAEPGMLHHWDGHCWCFLTPWGIVECSGSLFYLARLMARVEGTGGRLSAVGLLVGARSPPWVSSWITKLFQLFGSMHVLLLEHRNG